MEKEANGAEVIKKPYRSPTMRIYGDLTAITSTVGNTKILTDKAKGFDKTT